MVQSDSSGIPLPRKEMPDWLHLLRSAFLASLLSLGLKTSTVRIYAPAVDWLCAEAGRRGLTTPDDVDGSRFLRRSGSRCRRGFRFTAGAIAEVLTSRGEADNIVEPFFLEFRWCAEGETPCFYASVRMSGGFSPTSGFTEYCEPTTSLNCR